jgi:hypothetical protein
MPQGKGHIRSVQFTRIPGKLPPQMVGMGGVQSTAGGRFRIDNLSEHTVILKKCEG